MKQSISIVDQLLASDVIHLSSNAFLVAEKNITADQDSNTRRWFVPDNDVNKLFVHKNMTWRQWAGIVVNRLDLAMEKYDLYLDFLRNLNGKPDGK